MLASNCFQMRPNASQWVRMDPNGSEQVRKPRKTRKNFEKPRENYETLLEKLRKTFFTAWHELFEATAGLNLRDRMLEEEAFEPEVELEKDQSDGKTFQAWERLMHTAFAFRFFLL